jgi:cytochrome bd-type quinol oxidase subunit 2
MNKYLKTFAIFISVWFIASLLNGLLSGICIAVIGKNSFINQPGTIVLACVFSFLFSIPLVGLVWLVTVIAQAYQKKGHSLFQIILVTTFCCAVIGAVIFINVFENEFKQAKFAAGLCIIFSAVASVLIFRNQLKNNE